MTRTITDHKVNPANDKLTITVLDETGIGGAPHAYGITGHDEERNPFFTGDRKPEWCAERLIVFHNGPIAEVGVNGVTNEALLAILIDRMRCFRSGPFACIELDLALTKLEEARLWLHHRTLARMTRGIEGTHTV